MAKVAIYETFYRSAEYPPQADIVGRALADSGHEVIRTATDIRSAARQIIHLASLEVPRRPDIVIMGGRLEGERDYRRNPLTISEPCMVRRPTWWGGAREEAGKRITYLLPQFEQNGASYHFPSIVTIGNVSEDPPSELAEQWSAGMGGVAARVLSRVIKTYLPEAGRLGISSDPMFDAELSMEGVSRQSPNAVQQLQEQIRQLTGESQ